MAEDAPNRLRDAERALLVFGCVSLLALTVMQLIHRVDTVEIVATLLFMFVFVAFVMFDMTGGLVAALIASGLYLVFRLPAIDIVGSSAVVRLVAGRAVAFLAFGALGGYAHQVVYRSLSKLDEVDVIDDGTGLANARSLVRDLDYEIARSNRYKNTFSISYIDVPDELFGALKPRRSAAILKELGTLLSGAVRATDRLAVSRGPDGLRIAVLLAETSAEGASIFANRWSEKLSNFLLSRNVALPRKVGESISYPDMANDVRRFRNEVARTAGLPLSVDMARR